MTEPSFYISGPMTDLPEFNYPAFQAAADKLRAEGKTVHSPHEVVHAATPEELALLKWEDFVRNDLVLMLQNCNAIILLPGWEQSRGARFEMQVAEVLGFAVYDLLPDGQIREWK